MKALAKLDLLVVADPHPTTWASLSVEAGRKDGTYLLPVCTQFESSGSRVASNRSLQWGEQIVPADLRDQGRLSGHLSDGEEARLRRQDVQEHQGRRRPPGAGGHPARDESRQLVDRLLRPVAGAPQAAHGEPEGLRSGHHARHRRVRPRATITACRGRAGARRRSSIRARRSSTTPTSTSWTAAARSAPASASSATASTCWPRAPIRRVRRSRTAIPNSPMACSRSSAGTPI